MADIFATIANDHDGPNRRVNDRTEVCIRICFDDQVNMNMAATLNMSDDGLLMAAGVPLKMGTPLTIFPLVDEMDVSLFELKGEVVRQYEDVLVPTYSDDRFMMGIRLELDDKQRKALARYVHKWAN